MNSNSYTFKYSMTVKNVIKKYLLLINLKLIFSAIKLYDLVTAVIEVYSVTLNVIETLKVHFVNYP